MPYQDRQAPDPIQLKEMRTLVEDVLLKKQEPQLPNTRATQNIPEDIKAVQKKIKKDVTH